jgi:methenyltetrahydrofolate cyclohydrolase
MLVDHTVRELLAALAAPQAAPAGGSACALAAATGASLLMMVAGLSRTRSKADDDRTVLSDVLRVLTGIQQGLTNAIDADAVAYGRVVAALKLPKSPGTELNASDADVNRALRGASEVPLEIMRLSIEALKLAPVIAERCHRPAASDVVTAIALLRAGAEGARAAVSSNLRNLGNDDFVAMARREIVRLSTNAAEAMANAERWLAIG